MAGEPAAEDLVVGEPRWHMASAVLAAVVLTILMPDDLRLGPNWLLPVIVGALLVALIAGDPGRIDRRTTQLRALSLGLISVLVFSALWATVLLTSHLINGGKETDSAGALLEAGSIVWGSNIIAFALLYWELDGGGAAERAHRPSSRRVDFAFPQQMNPELAPAHWRPRFIDYLYLGFTNATAFSPTDAMPLAPLAKITMALQALISLVVLGLVIARSVNISLSWISASGRVLGVVLGQQFLLLAMLREEEEHDRRADQDRNDSGYVGPLVTRQEYPTATRSSAVCPASNAWPIEGSATLATARFRFATAATAIKEARTSPGRLGPLTESRSDSPVSRSRRRAGGAPRRT